MDIKACFICRQYGLNKCICDTKEGRYTLYYNAPLTCEERRFLCLDDAERKEFAIRVKNEPLSPYIIEILKDIKERKAFIKVELYNWQVSNQDVMKRLLLKNHLKQLNFDYIKQKENEKKKYRKTLIYGIIFMILFTISIIFLWNCTTNQDEIFAYDWNESQVITDWDCEEIEKGL